MSLVDYLDKGASLGADEPCLVGADRTLTYGAVVAHSYAVAAALARSGVAPGDKVGILSGNDVTAFATVFGIARRGAVWCPINPRNEAEENRQLLELFDCSCLLYQAAFAPLVAAIAPRLPAVHTWVCLDTENAGHPSLAAWLAGAAAPSASGRAGAVRGVDGPDGVASAADRGGAPDVPAGAGVGPAPGVAVAPAAAAGTGAARGSGGAGAAGWLAAAPLVDDLALLVGTGGTTGLPKGVMLTGRNIETMTALTLMGYPFRGRPTYLALAPLTHAAGVLCFPIMAHGGRIVVMAKPDIGQFLELVERHRVTHTFLPPTLIYMLLAHERLATTDLSSLQCFWYGAAPMSAARLEEAITTIGPVMAQLFGQSEAPMMIAMMPPSEHLEADGSVARRRLSAAGRPGPLVTVAIMNDAGELLPIGERGEIVVRSSLVMAGYYKNPEATAEASRFGWHHTGDIGFLDDEGYLHVVDRAKDMIISGGFNVYSAEVEQALMQHPAIADCAVIGLPDDKWGERVTAVLQLRPGGSVTPEEAIAFAKARIGSVKAPKQIEIWPDLPRSKVGKVLKAEVKAELT